MKNLENEFQNEIESNNYSENIETPVVEEKSSHKLEIRNFTKEYSPWARQKLADEFKRARIMRDLKEVSPEDTKEKITKLQEDFYQRFVEQKSNFENSLEERDITNIAKEKSVFFVHSIPTNEINRWNTGMNNETGDISQLSVDDILKNIKEKSPDLSCSSVSFKERSSPNEKERVGTMYPFGVVLSKGIVLSTYRYDGSTLSEKDKKHKKSKYDPDVKDTSIQENIGEKVNSVLDRKYDRYLNPESGYYDGYIDKETGLIGSKEPEGKQGFRGEFNGRDFDEFVVSKPKIDGLYVDMDNPAIQNDWDGPTRLESINDLVHKYKGVPVYVKSKDKVSIYVYETGDSVRVIEDIDSFKGLKSLEDLIE